jgi:diketogulonate reductase-like aldo/keto reductase
MMMRPPRPGSATTAAPPRGRAPPSAMMARQLLVLLCCAASCSPALGPKTGDRSRTRFSSLTLVGERWNNGQWARLDADGKMVGPATLKRGVTVPSSRLPAAGDRLGLKSDDEVPDVDAVPGATAVLLDDAPPSSAPVASAALPLTDIFIASPSTTASPATAKLNVSCWRLGSVTNAGDGVLIAWANGHLATPGLPACADASDNLLGSRRSTARGVSIGPLTWLRQHWTPEQMAGGGTPLYDPATNTLALHYQVGPRPVAGTAAARAHRNDNSTLPQVWQVTSTSRGSTWSVPTRVDGGFGVHAGICPGPGAGIVLRHPAYAPGRWLMGGWHMAKQGAAPQPGNGGITALAYYSDHAGHVGSWVPSSRPAVLNGPYGEPSIVELSNGSVVLNLRLDFWQFSASMLPKAHCGISRSSGSAKPPKGSTWYSCRGLAISHDGGQTFTDPWLDGRLVSPDDVASVVRGFASPKHTAAWGPLYYSSPLVQAKPRDNLTVLVSDTDGRSWRRPASFGGVVWSGDTKYSSMAPINSSHVAVLFERGGHNASSLTSSPTMYSLISFGVIDVSVVMKQDDEISGAGDSVLPLQPKPSWPGGGARWRRHVDFNINRGCYCDLVNQSIPVQRAQPGWPSHDNTVPRCRPGSAGDPLCFSQYGASNADEFARFVVALGVDSVQLGVHPDSGWVTHWPTSSGAQTFPSLAAKQRDWLGDAVKALRAAKTPSYTPVYANLRGEADYARCHDIMPRQTTGYTSVTLLSHTGNTSTLVVAYDRLSNGWKGPTAGARWGGSDRVFTMRVHISSHSPRRSKSDDSNERAPLRSNDFDDHDDNDAVSSGPAMPTVEVAPGVNMPMVNMGGYAHCHQRGCGGALCRSVADCPGAPSNYSMWLALGNKGIDTAWQYFTQPTIKHAIAGLLRAAVFLTTKIPTGQSKTGCLNMADSSPATSPGNVSTAANYYIAENLRELGVAQVDMLLMHGPCATAELNLVAWRVLEAAQRRGDTRAIGVSNFDEPTLASLLPQARIRPAINQCSFGVGNHLKGASGSLKYCQENRITFEADHTLDGSANSSLFNDPVVRAVAAAHGKSAAQILMKWVVQQGAMVVTGSMSSDYDREDAGLWGWNLTDAEMHRLAALSFDEEDSSLPETTQHHTLSLKTTDEAAAVHDWGQRLNDAIPSAMANGMPSLPPPLKTEDSATAVQHIGSGGIPGIVSFRGVLLTTNGGLGTVGFVPVSRCTNGGAVGVPCNWKRQLVNITARTPYVFARLLN